MGFCHFGFVQKYALLLKNSPKSYSLMLKFCIWEFYIGFVLMLMQAVCM